MRKQLVMTTMSLAVLLSAFSLTEKVTYTVDTEKSTVKWTGYHLAKSYEHDGNISIKSGSLEVKNGKITAGSFVIDMTSLSNNDIEGDDNSKLVKHLKADDFFDVEKYPEAKLAITKINGSKATGEITIKGVTEKINFDITNVKVTDDMVAAAASLNIDRTKHKVMYGWTIANAVLSNEFKLDVSIVAVR